MSVSRAVAVGENVLVSVGGTGVCEDVRVGVLVAALGCAAVVGTGFDPAVAVLAEVAVVAGVVWIHRRAGRTESAPEGWEPGWCRFASLP